MFDARHGRGHVETFRGEDGTLYIYLIFSRPARRVKGEWTRNPIRGGKRPLLIIGVAAALSIFNPPIVRGQRESTGVECQR